MFGGNHVLTQAHAATERLSAASNVEGVTLYQNEASAPRVSVVNNAVAVEDAGAALDAIQNPDMSWQEAVVEAPAPALHLPGPHRHRLGAPAP